MSVRPSASEYGDLCHLSAVTGACSLSDLTRDAVRLLLKISACDRLSVQSLEGFQARMDQLSRRFDELQAELKSPELRADEKTP